MDGLILEVKKKSEFSEIPNSIIERSLKLNKNNVKLARAFLRKYFGVFMTNKVAKGKDIEILKSHISSKKRDYQILYSRIKGILGSDLKSIVDLGCGANGFSYPFIFNEFGELSYLGVEATGQLVASTNKFFELNNFNNARVICSDILNFEDISKTLASLRSPKAIFLLQTIDALESLEPNFSKKLLLVIKESLSFKDFIVISNSLKSISGKSQFKSRREWLKNFLSENFKILEVFELFDEEFIVCKNK